MLLRYPELKCKGADTRIVLAWLNDELQQRSCEDHDILTDPWIEHPRNPECFGVCFKFRYVVLFWSCQFFSMPCLQFVWLANSWISLLCSADMFLTPEEDRQRMVVGKLMMQLYVRMPRNALDRNLRLFRCRPKLHLLHHMAEDVRPSRLNPAHLSCWMDEDSIKRTMHIKRMVHKRLATQRCLERYKLGLLAKLKDAEKKLK